MTGRTGAGDDQKGQESQMDQGLTGRKRCPIEVGQDEEDWRGEVMGGNKKGRPKMVCPSGRIIL